MKTGFAFLCIVIVGTCVILAASGILPVSLDTLAGYISGFITCWALYTLPNFFRRLYQNEVEAYTAVAYIRALALCVEIERLEKLHRERNDPDNL